MTASDTRPDVSEREERDEPERASAALAFGAHAADVTGSLLRNRVIPALLGATVAVAALTRRAFRGARPVATAGSGMVMRWIDAFEGALVPLALRVSHGVLRLVDRGESAVVPLVATLFLRGSDTLSRAPARRSIDARPAAAAPAEPPPGRPEGDPGDDEPRRPSLLQRSLAWFDHTVVGLFMRSSAPEAGAPVTQPTVREDQDAVPMRSATSPPLARDPFADDVVERGARLAATAAPAPLNRWQRFWAGEQESTQPLAVAAAVTGDGFGEPETHSGFFNFIGQRLAAASVSAVGVIAAGVVLMLVFTEVGERTILTAVRRGTDSVDVELRLPDDVRFAALQERSEVFGADGMSLAVLDGELNREVVPLDDIPEHVRQAVIAAEDRRFYEHEGYDPEGIARAFVANVEAGETTQGGSTITQQLAKPLVGDQDTYARKAQEVAYAMRLEEEFTKDELLEQYLNQVYFGANAYGVAAAAEEYFRVAPQDLTVPQAALLAGLIRSPNTSNPREEPERAQAKRDSVLDSMAAVGFLDPALAEQYKAEPVVVQPLLERELQLPFVVNAALNEFRTSPRFAEFGATAVERQQALDFGGLQIHLTIDPRLQQLAGEVLRERFPPGGPAGAIATVEPASGRILAAEGSLNYEEEQYNLATQGRRQPGSTFKPFVYAAALQEGLPVSLQLDGKSPAIYENVPGWRSTDQPPGIQNYGNRSYGPLDMRSALRSSVNTAAAQLVQIVGAQRTYDTAQRMGIDMHAATVGPDGIPVVVPAIALGGLEQGVTPLEMASAYGTFANSGVSVTPTIIDRITNRQGDLLYEGIPLARQAIEPGVAATMVSLMRGVVTGGTGTAASIPGWQVAGKTGTTQRSTDAWFVGYTPTMSTAMWMGYPDSNRRSTGETGGEKPASVWRQYMVQALAGQTPVPFPDVEQTSGQIATGIPTTVPEVRGLDQVDAMRLLLDVRLIGQVSLVPSASERGTVLWQSPRGGTQAESGDEVRIGVSTGEPPAPPPEPESSESGSDSSDSPDSSSTPSTAPSAAVPAEPSSDDAGEEAAAPDAAATALPVPAAEEEGDG